MLLVLLVLIEKIAATKKPPTITMKELNQAKADRIASIDFLRGLVMIIMALDHVRDFFHVSALTADPLDPAITTAFLFFTRWITHFCAPAFVFLSGVSAFLSAQNKPVGTASSFMLKRGFWLVLVDFFIMSFALTFDISFGFIMLTVLWAIGWSMIILGVLMRLAPKAILPLGLLLFFGHNLFGYLNLSPGGSTNFLQILFTGRVIVPVTANHVIGFLYSILPWTSVMLLGYWFGKHVNNRAMALRAGLALILLFIITRFINVYGDPVPWKEYGSAGRTVLSFFNTTKYPPSLQFLCMTLGPALLLIAFFQWKGSRFQRFVSTYGVVPFFYYVAHFFVAHLLLIVAFFATGHTVAQIKDPKSPFLFRPADFGFSLPGVYLVWITVVLLLYFPCRWFYNYKQTHKKWWLRYL